MEEGKVYPIVGQVTISTEEYRDLVYKAVTKDKEASESWNRMWRAEDERDKAKKAEAASKAELQQLMSFLRDKPEIYAQYIFWLDSKKEDKTDEA